MNARKGWIGDPQPQRDHKPSHALKWYKMMGAAHLLAEAADDSAELNPLREGAEGCRGRQR